MRFLIFNLVVVGALFYLFAGGQPFKEVDRNGMLGKVALAVEKTVTSGRQMTAAVIDKVMGETETPAAPVVPAPKLAAKLPENLTPPAIKAPPIQSPPIHVPVQKVVPPRLAELTAPQPPAIVPPTIAPPAIKNAAVRQRRAEVMATGPVASQADKAKFMTPRQRRRELHALSEEMELLFASTRVR